MSVEVTPLDSAAQSQYYPALLDKIRTFPGVEAAGAIDQPPLIGGASIAGTQVDGGDFAMVVTSMILPGYFEAMGTPIRQGRSLRNEDLRRKVPAALINEAAVRDLFKGGPVLGRRLETGAPGNFVEVIGVVGDTRQWGPMSDAEAEVYVPFKPSKETLDQAQGLTIIVRTRGPAPGLAAAVRDAATSIGPRVLVDRVRAGTDWLGERVLTPRRRTVLLGLLGALGLILTLVGVLGMTTYAVARRTQEIGVRMAFGARPGQVVGRIVRDSAIPVVIGVVIGIGGALLATRVIKTFLFETTPTDPLTLAAVAVTLAIAGTLAAWIPARRAARVDPVTALRAE